MQKLSIDMENCYGINKLAKTFDFSKGKSQLIYAQNGSMKSSFAKTFDDIANKKFPIDLIYHKEPKCEIKCDNNNIISDSIYVVHSEIKYFESDRMSTLLVDNVKKKQYLQIISRIEDTKDKLLAFLRSEVRNRSNEQTIIDFTNSFNRQDKDFLEIILEVQEIVKNGSYLFNDIPYSTIFDEKVIAFLQTKDFMNLLEEYVKIYDTLLDASHFLKKWIFNHNNVEDVYKSLKENNFFKANNNIIIRDKDWKENVILNDYELKKLIDEDINKILDNPILKKKFEEIDTKLKQKQYQAFRTLLVNHSNKWDLIKKLQNIYAFRKEYRLLLLQLSWPLYEQLVSIVISTRTELEEIYKLARLQETKRARVVDIFNNRFSVPFTLEVENKEDVVLKWEVLPNIVFNYKTQKVNKDVLLNALSTWERRALYILNILFEIEARKEIGIESLLILDDIADSFDYANKYAIVEYLYEISEESNNIYMLILTHNFDFYRTVNSRVLNCDCKRDCSFIISKNDSEITFHRWGDKNILAPFNNWMKQISSNKVMFISSLPFIRNLVEYREWVKSNNYWILTALLHIKSNTFDISIADLAPIYSDTINNVILSYPSTDKIVDYIFEEADKVVSNDSINLEDKILLSIAIRLKAEMFMYSKVSCKDEIKWNQTWILLWIYKKKFESDPNQQKILKILKKVNLMTSENIHINSFMYEPILDMWKAHLIELYQEVKLLV